MGILVEIVRVSGALADISSTNAAADADARASADGGARSTHAKSAPSSDTAADGARANAAAVTGSRSSPDARGCDPRPSKSADACARSGADRRAAYILTILVFRMPHGLRAQRPRRISRRLSASQLK